MQIPIFFSVTTAAGQRSLSAAIASLQTHANLNHTYHIHILNDALAQKQPRSLKYLQRENFLIKFSPSVSSVLEIPALFPEYDKGVYKKGNTEMIVSSGCGSHKVHLRLFNKQEAMVVDIHGHLI